MRLSAGCELTFESEVATPLVLMLRPRSGYGQWVAREAYELTPFVPVVEYVDGYGNLCQRLTVPVGTLTIRAEASVETAETIDVALATQFGPAQLNGMRVWVDAEA